MAPLKSVAHPEPPHRGPGGTTGSPLLLKRGQLLFRRGEPAASIFSIESGRFRLERHLEDGATVTLAVLGPGDFVAEAALFSDTYHCDARAEVSSRVWTFSKREVADGLARDPEALMSWFKGLASQVRRLRALLELRSIKRADERVLAYLDLLEALGEDWDPDRPLQAVASELGLVPESLYRALGRLERQNQIHREGRRVGRKT